MEWLLIILVVLFVLNMGIVTILGVTAKFITSLLGMLTSPFRRR